MREEARKYNWNMFKGDTTEEELDKATLKLHETINNAMDVVAPWITIQMNPKTHREMDDRRPTAQNLGEIQ